MTEIDRLEKEFKKKFGDKSVFLKEQQKVSELKERWNKALEQMQSRKPSKSRFVETEFSRFKVTLLKDNSIFISELNEETAQRLFDNIENAS